jgi:hypothetical protein
MKLEPGFQSATGKGGRCNALPFCFCPLTVFSIIFDALANCLGTDRTNVSVLIIVNDGWDLGISANMFLSRITTTLISENDRLRYKFSLETYYRVTPLISGTSPGSRMLLRKSDIVQGNYYD